MKKAEVYVEASGISEVRRQAVEVTEGLKRMYFDVVRPLEADFLFNEFHSSPWGVGDFDARPSILLIGQYSTGKTSFIKFLIGRDFPGQRIGPEPTTDRFMAVMYGDQERCIPGNAAAAQADRPWTGLQKFGVEFLNRFECSEVPAPVLQEITLIDSPGILSGEKQRLQRGYDFVKVCRWFAERADKILLLFDAHKLDISDEFKRTIEGISFAHSKISVVLNKADMISHQELMRVYGALMWSLGKVMKTPEVARVYVGSFWENAKTDHIFVKLFQQERADLLSDLRTLPKASSMSKVNELVRRCRLLKVHICIINELKESMPSFFGKSKKTQELIENLGDIFLQVQKRHQLAVGDFPNLEDFKEKLNGFDFAKFKKMNTSKMDRLDHVLSFEIPKLINNMTEDSKGKVLNPFEEAAAGLMSVPGAENEWAVPASTLQRAADIFITLTKTDDTSNRVSGLVVKTELEKTGLETKVLRAIWNLACIDGLGALDKEEFAVALHLTDVVLAGKALPSSLPLALVPPSKRSSPFFAS
eukprot:c12434_g2_i1.p1 GENE.c12434_g2_i1~~c12434_g2_i1.p1  ORF type:complete len:561 (-),score=127.15 c12434_g2_i1:203-1798(-)